MVAWLEDQYRIHQDALIADGIRTNTTEDSMKESLALKRGCVPPAHQS